MEFNSKFSNLIIKHGMEKEAGANPDFLKKVKIVNGVLVEGIIDDAAIGEGKGKLSDWLAKEYPRDVVRGFYDALNGVTVSLITRKGMTVGLDEFKASDAVQRIKKTAIEQELQEGEDLWKSFKSQHMESIPGRTLRESFEIKMMQLGAEKKKMVENQLLKEKIVNVSSHHPQMDASIMILSGSRGNPINLVNIAGLWGQAAVREGRPRRGFNDRLIVANKKGDLGALAGGFIEQNFMQGMGGREFFYHSMGGRQGEVDTGVSTKVSGYLYRRLANALKDLVICYDQTVRTSNANVIQFLYGEDGIFPANTTHGKNIVVLDVLNKLGAKKGKGAHGKH